jgi:hypothetical protein
MVSLQDVHVRDEVRSVPSATTLAFSSFLPGVILGPSATGITFSGPVN